MTKKSRSRFGQYLTALLVISSVSSVAFGPRAAFAADPPAPAASGPATGNEAAEGKRHFELGLKLFKEQVFDAALLEFQQSYALGKRPTALRNVAQCHRELKHFVDAYEAFDRLLTDHAAQLKDAEKKDIVRAMSDLALVTATLEVKVSEPGADILLDGKTVAQSPAPKRLRVGVGPHKVRAQKVGFDAAETEILLVGQQDGSVELAMKPEVKLGHLVVRERSNAAVRVFVDGKDMGPAPWEGDLPPGPHAVEARGERLSAPTQTVEIANKAKSELVVEASSTAARFKITTQPPSAVIALDGQKVATGLFDADVTAGEHKLDVTAAGFAPYTKQVSAVAGQTLAQDVTLVAEAPKADVAPPDKPEDYWGVYGNVSLFAQFGLAGSHGLYDPCAKNQTCQTAQPVGGGLAVRIGYAFDFFGIEAVGIFMGEYRTESMSATGLRVSEKANPLEPIGVTSDTKRNEDIYLAGYHGFVGAGPRVTSKDQVARFTFGVTPGVALRNYVIGRTINVDVPPSVPMVYDDDAHGNAFALLLDGGILIGSTPGSKLSLGVVAWFDFANDIRSTGGSDQTIAVPGVPSAPITRPQYQVTNGTNVYIGPSIGLTFGH